MIKNICIISKKYPSEKRMGYTFLEELVNKFSDYDINCYVISPESVLNLFINKKAINRKKYFRYSDNHKRVTVYSPRYLSFSKISKFVDTHFPRCSGFEIVTKKVFKKLNKKIKFDAIYAQFIYPSALVANKLGKKHNIPVFFAYGEDTDYSINYLGPQKTKCLLSGVKGVISVSSSNKERLINNGIVNDELIGVFPNGINLKKFHKKDKYKMRRELGFRKEDFIVVFVGRFVETKGIDRLCEALKIINNDKIKAIIIGEGKLIPNYKNIIFKGSVKHDDLSSYLSSGDVFVLPTRAEGCSNSIIEALACGLPVISSKKSFNDEILDYSCSIRIDEMSVNEIKEAIETLYNDSETRIKMSENALQKAKQFNIDDRARNILEFMESKI